MSINTDTDIRSQGKGNSISGTLVSTSMAPASHADHQPTSLPPFLFRGGRRNRSYVMLLWLLTSLFAARVLGQAVQRWMPQPYLPPFHAFQGSGLPYWLLLTAQVVILTVMVRAARAVQKGTLTFSQPGSVMLGWFGWLYMTASLGRIGIGLAWVSAPAWFSTWIPAFFHLVLAGFVLILHDFTRTQSHRAA